MPVPTPRPHPDDPPRPEIAESWRRAAGAGLTPEATPDRVSVSDFDRTSKLMVAANPVLDELLPQLEYASLCLILADRHCRIVGTRFAESGLEGALERIGAVPGSTYSEEISGTNSVATPYETRRGLLVNGEEHYLESLKKFSCYGHPIHHPITRRLEGVLDITGAMPQANPLFVPFVRRAVRDIEQRLLEGAPRGEQFLLAAFQNAAKQHSHAVVAFGDGIVLTNPAALDLLDPADHAVLRALAADVSADRTMIRSLRLASGRVVTIEASRASGTSGTLFRLVPRQERTAVPAAHPAGWLAAPAAGVEQQLTRLSETRSVVLISGEPGTGRSHAVRTVAADDPVVTLDAADVPSLGEGPWGDRLATLAATHQGVVAVEEIQLLPAALCVRLTGVLADASARFVLTSTRRDRFPAHVAALAASCVAHVELPPLRRRREELPALVDRMARALRADAAVRFTPSALTALAAQQWPGNLRELSMVVRHAVTARSAGDITAADLPEAYRGGVEARSLTPWEQAELDAIVAALRETRGNKRRAAERLGISRSTLYNRIRSLRIGS
ncbi:sigma-54-dependent Fis family transcriptional regulator [Haloechinothrix halophila]|uniref:sigma-54-dependent Fis family transcriptional regulator n=1 Tax=Haloechinothrix halophila TaxID=1069073 RepID=UPI000422AAA5|nr:helix-turn-helix domain-containing protein [Haloechinothrix halophila]